MFRVSFCGGGADWLESVLWFFQFWRGRWLFLPPRLDDWEPRWPPVRCPEVLTCVQPEPPDIRVRSTSIHESGGCVLCLFWYWFCSLLGVLPWVGRPLLYLFPLFPRWPFPPPWVCQSEELKFGALFPLLRVLNSPDLLRIALVSACCSAFFLAAFS